MEWVANYIIFYSTLVGVCSFVLGWLSGFITGRRK